jgi:2-amino-4-hydroxy-6-hydroxymethyldihydropteridine diphosphokinase
MKAQAARAQIVYIGVGSNLGNRRQNIRQALNLLDQTPGIRVKKISSISETDPVGGPRQGKYLNAVASISTTVTPAKLLKTLQAIEKQLGRVRTIKNGPRTIDLDILLYGNRGIKTKRLTIPHPRMFERDFILKPLLEIHPAAFA